jgi:hypothetical protein
LKLWEEDRELGVAVSVLMAVIKKQPDVLKVAMGKKNCGEANVKG